VTNRTAIESYDDHDDEGEVRPSTDGEV